MIPVRFENANLPIDVRALHTTNLDDSAMDVHSPQIQEVLRALGVLIERQRMASSATSSSRPMSSVSGRVAIRVLPFANMSGDPEQEHFSDGITEERMKRALLIDPDNWTMRYNFACLLVIHLNEIDAALETLGPELEKATIGRLNHVKVDPDFPAVRDHPRFKAMIAAAEARVAMASHGGSA